MPNADNVINLDDYRHICFGVKVDNEGNQYEVRHHCFLLRGHEGKHRSHDGFWEFEF